MVRAFITLVFVGILGLAFARLALDFAPDAALNTTAQYYAENTVAETGAQNIVAAVIVTYRGLDTLGEVTVLFLTAAIIALVLAQSSGHVRGSGLLPAGELLETGAKMLVPLILLFGIYIFVNGHLTPGGGFQGGAVLASAMLLLLLANPVRRFSHGILSWIESGSGFFYVVISVLGLVLGSGFLDNRILPLGSYGAILSAGAIPLIYTLIGLKVGAEFSSILESLEETEDR